jgi:hypothetical protein
LLPLEQAFCALSRFDRAAEWDPGVASGEMLTPEPVQLGSRFALGARIGGRSVPLEYEITTFEPTYRLVLHAENVFVRSIDTITFEALGSTTEITYDARLEPKGIAHLARPLLGFALRRIGDRAAAGLHAYLNAAVDQAHG